MHSTYLSCPHCGAGAGVRILYGDPPPALRAAAARGEVILAGATAGDASDPDTQCTRCGHKWRQGERSTPPAVPRRSLPPER